MPQSRIEAILENILGADNPILDPMSRNEVLLIRIMDMLKGYGLPPAVSEVAQMIDPNQIYVYTGSESGYTAGNWYYYNGTAWTSGGAYDPAPVTTDPTLSIPDRPADAKATGEAVTDLKSAVNEIDTLLNLPQNGTVTITDNFPSYTRKTAFANLHLKKDTTYVITYSFEQKNTTQGYGAISKTDNTTPDYDSVSLLDKQTATLEYTPSEDITVNITVRFSVTGTYSVTCAWTEKKEDVITEIKGDITQIETDVSSLDTSLDGEITRATAAENLKVNKPITSPNGTNGQILRTLGDGSTEWVDVGLPTDEQTAEAVSDWLDEHPEATTTVQDGSLTEAKFTDDLKLKTVKDYVTPQMYGAKGNGYNDDTAAVQAAIDSGYDVVLPKGTYKLLSSLEITNKNRFIFDASMAMLDYMGTGYAIVFKYCRYCDLKFDYIYARNGGGLNFVADGENTWSQYINIEFNILNVLTNGIHAIVEQSGQWINEFRIKKGRFQNGANAIKVETAYASISGWHLTECAFEGVTNGLDLNCSHVNGISGYTLINCRYDESFDTLMKTSGIVKGILIVGTSSVKSSILQLSEETYGHIISRFARSTGTIISGSVANIVKGKAVKENRTDNLTIISTYADTTVDLTTIDSLEIPHYIAINSSNVNKLILPNFAGVENGMNDYYLVFTKAVTSGDPFEIEQGGTVIKSFTSQNNKNIHAMWNKSVGWKYFTETSV